MSRLSSLDLTGRMCYNVRVEIANRALTFVEFAAVVNELGGEAIEMESQRTGLTGMFTDLPATFALRLWLPDEEACAVTITAALRAGMFTTFPPSRDLISGLEMENAPGWQLVLWVPGRLVEEAAAMMNPQLPPGKPAIEEG